MQTYNLSKRQNPYSSTPIVRSTKPIYPGAAFRPTTLMMKRPISRPMIKNPTGEAGYVDLAAATYGINTTGSITLIATIPQGASSVQRVGKKAFYKSITVRGSAYSNTTTTISDGGFIVVYDRRPGTALPAITDILTAASPNAFMNDAFSGRFEVLRRCDYAFCGNTTTPTTGKEIENVDIFIPMKKRPVVFKAAGTGAIGDIDEGALYLVTYGSVASGTAAASLFVSFRTRFTEH